MSTPALLAFEGIEKSFGAVRALRGVSFELRAGEVHALLGENGAGKSTLIRLATGAHAPDAGALVLAGQRRPRLDPAAARAHGIACIYQQPALFPDLTGARGASAPRNCCGARGRTSRRTRRCGTCRCRSNSWSRSPARWGPTRAS